MEYRYRDKIREEAKKKQVEYIESLYDHSSEETKKAKRNTSFISFIIISMYFLETPLRELPIIKIYVCPENEWKLLLIAIILSIFWVFMFLLNHYRDYKIYEWKNNHLREQYKTVKNDKKRYDDFQKHKTSNKNEISKNNSLNLNEKEKLNKELDDINKKLVILENVPYIYNLYEEFIEKEFNPKEKFSKIINGINIIIPVSLFLISFVILLARFIYTIEHSPVLKNF